ncbi:DUF2931 family protein [Acinetobacter gerneri]|uniref:DUF2931 family protein n=2 Tax=Acinetobacter gerneri TaxID=202952 RepID=N8ZQ59_9GAMM|nr:DUF2931 family protein [Acinetobacter gerneri]ENV33893.1 hypothetical protein F960_01899 [Acinetobacter gerneri DSM 14967 = CIP 107464 = MTCC 9824]EPR82769.1 hypothetical protein L289_2687 [Acinetobacter gerneri DSM 14967 = CIP 107464 = MTCC 9824]MDQ9010216.1 DUF2931 family protein [Acinetobacter gerneri]MDQ9014371.1 DUF2931 family protein [Acinetobacter gerneri]MDQ9025542.1 DUF2931 family protein [Acinetobacter gerneri]
MQKIFRSDKIEWSTELYTPRHYPIRLVTGDCFWFYSNSKSRIGFSGGAAGGWRSTGSYIRGGMPDKKVRLPDAVQLTWLSETERKFYQVQIELPRDQILDLFHKPMLTLEYQEKVFGHEDGIDFAFEPGGMVFLRLSSAKGIELGRYQAKEIPMEWWYFSKAEGFDARWVTEEKYYELSNKELPERIQKQYQEKKIPVGRWLNYSTHTFPWKILLSKLKMEAYYIQYVNAEQYLVTHEMLEEEQAKKKHVPAEITFYYEIDGIRYKHNIYLSDGFWGKGEEPEDDVVIFNSFNEFFKQSSQPAILEFQLINGNLSASLHNGQRKVDIKIFNQAVSKLKKDQY